MTAGFHEAVTLPLPGVLDQMEAKVCVSYGGPMVALDAKRRIRALGAGGG